ncbi:MAG: hypothetical protein WAQ53_10625 [Thiofilum sp.]|uniref:hypothetical protein n=1 Tax=Thiofilum sp. TaxID=2212733 RepID=UPI0025E7E5DB|nr:hypothetical protein [Thiofilum sp.]MBK8453315.1 hypothetical protein [Thiofilum sp.]
MFTLHQEKTALSDNPIINKHYEIITRALGVVAQHPELGKPTEQGRSLARGNLFENTMGMSHLAQSYRPISEVYQSFKTSLKILEELEPNSENLKALEDLKDKTNELRKSLEGKKANLKQDIKNAQAIITRNNEGYALLIASGSDQEVERIDQENLNLSNAIELYNKKLILLDLGATFIINAQEQLINSIINRLIANYKKLKLTSLVSEYDQAKKGFLEACAKLVKYDSRIFFEKHTITSLVTKETLFQELELELKALPTANRQELVNEILSAA